MTTATRIRLQAKPTACADDPALFASTDVLDHRAAAAHCRVCPIAERCSRDVATDAVGTWAGRLRIPAPRRGER